MKTIVIPQKMSGTGSIHDLASQHFDREIRLPNGSEFAVVLIAYYGNNLYSTHRSWESAMRESKKQSRGGWEHSILNKDGYIVEPEGYYELPSTVGEPYTVKEVG